MNVSSEIKKRLGKDIPGTNNKVRVVSIYGNGEFEVDAAALSGLVGKEINVGDFEISIKMVRRHSGLT